MFAGAVVEPANTCFRLGLEKNERSHLDSTEPGTAQSLRETGAIHGAERGPAHDEPSSDRTMGRLWPFVDQRPELPQRWRPGRWISSTSLKTMAKVLPLSASSRRVWARLSSGFVASVEFCWGVVGDAMSRRSEGDVADGRVSVV
jgi:hypothetical protein